MRLDGKRSNGPNVVSTLFIAAYCTIAVRVERVVPRAGERDRRMPVYRRRDNATDDQHQQCDGNGSSSRRRQPNAVG